MLSISGIKIPNKFKPVLTYLYCYRGATADQLLTFIHAEKYPPGYILSLFAKDRPKINKLYATLKEMKQRGLVQFKKTEYTNRRGEIEVFYLTKEGADIAKELLVLNVDAKGTGFNNDIGDFPHKLQQPPLERLQHHLLLIDFFIVLNYLRIKHPSLVLDFRDNRYVSERYQELTEGEVDNNEKITVFKPDGELKLTYEVFDKEKNALPDKITDKTYYIEIDRGTEYLEELKNKFKGYDRYFSMLTKEGRPLPEAILFVTGAKEQDYNIRRRWKTISTAFLSTLGKWSAKVNLIFAPMNHVERIIIQETKFKNRLDDLIDKVRFYLSEDNGLFLMGEDYDIFWGDDAKAVVSIVSQDKGGDILFLFERSNGYETRGICRSYELMKDFNNIKKKRSEFENMKKIVPALLTYDHEFRPLNPDLFKDKKTAELLMTDSYTLNIMDNPSWSFGNGKEVLHKNPLTAF